MKTITGLMLAGALVAATAPKISDADKALYFKNAIILSGATAQANKAQADFNAQVTKLQTICGKNFQLIGDASGDPVCQPKPVEKKEKK
jgi:hypothetical protein